MTDEGDQEKIRALLEPHGYVIERNDEGQTMTTNWGHEWLTAIVHPNHHGGRIPLAGWKNALIHFLDDKAQLGAKQEEIHFKAGSLLEVTGGSQGGNGEPYQEGWIVVPRHNWPEKFSPFGESIHEATNQCYLKIHGLKDPREKVTI